MVDTIRPLLIKLVSHSGISVGAENYPNRTKLASRSFPVKEIFCDLEKKQIQFHSEGYLASAEQLCKLQLLLVNLIDF